MRKAVMILLALLAIRLLPRALRRQARTLELITLLFQIAAASAANTSKTASVEARTGNLETRVGDLEKGQFSNLQSGGVIGTLQRGIFTGVSGGTVTLTGGNVTLHCGALSQLDTESQTAFLSGLRKLNHLSGQPTDGNTGSSWASGERGFINNCVQWINDIDGDLQAKGWMN